MYQILQDRIIEKAIEEIIGMKIIAEKEVGVGLQKGQIQATIENMTEVTVIVSQGQV